MLLWLNDSTTLSKNMITVNSEKTEHLNEYAAHKKEYLYHPDSNFKAKKGMQINQFIALTSGLTLIEKIATAALYPPLYTLYLTHNYRKLL